jgi:hypothetical protein
MDGSREIAEWDWVVTKTWSRLHAPLDWDDPDEEMHVEDGRTVCGHSGLLLVPGVFTRMGAMRCKHCCRMTGMPPGRGSPKNDDACRPIAEQRIAALALGTQDAVDTSPPRRT